MKKLANMREDYRLKTLDESDVLKNPFEQFNLWFEEAVKSKLNEPNAMILATVSVDGQPSARVVLLKGLEKDGFVFYTNYNSDKAKELLSNPKVAIVFHWHGLQRQVRIEGLASKTTKKKSLAYFQSRPLKSQIGAWSSPQSTVLENRQELENKVRETLTRFKGLKALPLPPFWGGIKIKPTRFEFWQGRSSRLHDRMCYKKVKRSWKIERLAP